VTSASGGQRSIQLSYGRLCSTGYGNCEDNDRHFTVRVKAECRPIPNGNAPAAKGDGRDNTTRPPPRATGALDARNKPSSVRRRSDGRVISLGPPLLTASSSLPGIQMERAAPHPLFGLAPSGVYHATSVSGGPVRSYRTLSPLPVPPRGPSAVYSLRHFPSSAETDARALPGTLALWSSDFPPPESRRTRWRPTLRTPCKTRQDDKSDAEAPDLVLLHVLYTLNPTVTWNND
jgi:hypothetical protein